MESWTSKSEVLNRLTDIDGYQFERVVADIWTKQGWETKVTTASNDRGIDVIATRKAPFSQKHLIQAKCYSRDNAVSSKEIQQYASLKHQEPNVDAVIVVTTSYFSKQAQEIANDLNLKIINGDDLYDILSRNEGDQILQKYIDAPQKNSKPDKDTTAFKNNSGLQKNQPKSSNKPELNELDLDDSKAEIRKSQYIGSRCPVCYSSDTLWEIRALTKNEQYLCGSCNTRWKARTEEGSYGSYPEYSGITGYLRFLVNESSSPVVKLEVISGERTGEEHTLEEWREMSKKE